MSPALKLLIVFFAGGFLAGLVTVSLAQFAPVVSSVTVSLFLLLGVAASFAVSRKAGWLRMKPPLGRIIKSSLLVSAAYPISFLILIVVWSFCGVPNRPASETVERLDYDAGFSVGIYIAGLAGAGLVSLALWVLSGKRDVIVSLAFFAAAISTVALSFQFFSSFPAYLNEPSLLIILIGDSVFATLSALWISRAERTQPTPNS